ncbi:dTDP-4-dehydrorhamnose 3,5-epimerase [Mariprofundus erugo]|uniref:dTDP-4-dehydrorhamnose 3,5-epimerase n=1 Tax=Mariprofundus erugo TaxID=2528639 RepID=A0A5R9GYF6_9PROT|nr:dTDP-4-dehydrorhamnose 3,5-epimerase [Mariprofundus erugo]TLS69093.1 dTDP-4-dehydrorhamnose 3,5-epimerase [Mariprofundus erugo]
MKVMETALPGVLLIEPQVFSDARGDFFESYQQLRYAAFAIPAAGTGFVQDNCSRSRKGVLRGLHFQKRQPQGKLFSVTSGTVFDVVADVRPHSPCFGQWLGVTLSGENRHQLWVPPGYAHGYCVLSELADVHYKCTALYAPEDESGVVWNDPDLAISWPVARPLLSARDLALPSLAVIAKGDR